MLRTFRFSDLNQPNTILLSPYGADNRARYTDAQGAGKPNRTGSLDGEPDRPTRHHVHAADRGARNNLEFARAMKEAAN
jgi:hypothetical protein